MTKHAKSARGFTLIELLIVVAIIGLLAAMLIPNLLDAMQKAKQKRTLADIHDIGTGMMAWLSDQVAAGAAGADVFSLGLYSLLTAPSVEEALVPQYLQTLPTRDGWKYEFEFYLDLTPAASQAMAIRSPGRDGSFSGDTYTAGAFITTDYDQDIVWADGFFVRYPSGRGTS